VRLIGGAASPTDSDELAEHALQYGACRGLVSVLCASDEALNLIGIGADCVDHVAQRRARGQASQCMAHLPTGSALSASVTHSWSRRSRRFVAIEQLSTLCTAASIAGVEGETR
jgi:hypothetical protein